MKKEGPCAVYCVFLLVVTVENTLALTGPLGSVCGIQCCVGWDQLNDTCTAHCYNPCVHGTCVDTNVCECEPGWQGHDCRHDIDECWYETHACHHNCHNNDGCYTCSCDDGFLLINSTHCANSTTSTTMGPPQGTTEIPAHCVTATTSTVGRATTQPTRRTTRATASGLQPSYTATTTTVDRSTTQTPHRTTRTTATTTPVDKTTAQTPQRTTRTTDRGLRVTSTATTTTVDVVTTNPAQRTTRTTTSDLYTSPSVTTTTADVTTTTRRPLRTTRTTGAPGRRLTLPVHANGLTPPVTDPSVNDNGRSPVPHGGAGHQNAGLVIGAAVSTTTLILLVISIGILLFYIRRKKKAAASARQQFANLPQQPRGSLPGYSDTHWRNPAFENLYEEIPDLRSPPPPYEATEGCQASGGFAAVARMPNGGLKDTKDVGVTDVDISFAGATPAVPSRPEDNLSSTFCNLHVDVQKAPLSPDDGYEPLKKVPGNEYESLKRW